MKIVSIIAQEKKYGVFISSMSEDYPIAEKVYDFLVANGLTVFLAITELRRIGEAEYSEAVDAAIDVSMLNIAFRNISSYHYGIGSVTFRNIPIYVLETE